MMTIKTQSLFIFFVVFFLFDTLFGSVRGKFVQELVENLAVRSGKDVAVESVGIKNSAATIERLLQKYGEPSLKIINDGGIEFVEAVTKNGDEIYEIGQKLSPAARRILGKNSTELMPLIKNYGTEIAELETKVPGLSEKIFNVFGNDLAIAISKNVPAQDIPALLKYAEKADNPATKKLLLETYQKEGRSLFERIPPSLVLASGLSSSMFYGTHKITSSISTVVEKNPEIIKESADTIIRFFIIIFFVIICLILWKFQLMPWQKKKLSTDKRN